MCISTRAFALGPIFSNRPILYLHEIQDPPIGRLGVTSQFPIHQPRAALMRMSVEASMEISRRLPVWACESQVCQARANKTKVIIKSYIFMLSSTVWGSSPGATTVEHEGGALFGRLQGALRGGAAAASPSRVATSIRGYLEKVGSLQLRDTGERS
ncbi:unnamed protein product [Pieris macdunnoughi]|uniref:Uncharacterized protein n=1 Tax=Pieris macdunnoughi TaxID=345717 RepID=A0A821Q305_9NEOP|nr:unnamed protein product [Pieris macdunnoughi]